MNKKNTRKGFTIVELVIVIAVIAILAAVLIPTFGNVIEKANNTALIQEIKNEHTSYTAANADKEGYTENIYILIDGKYYEFADGEIVMSNKKPTGVDSIAAGAKYWDAANDEVKTAPTPTPAG